MRHTTTEGSEPTVSVVIPVFNQASTLRRALDSVFHQTVQPHEVIVVNDGSTDETPRVLQDYPQRVTQIGQENRGVSAARNRGMLHATGHFIALLDADDEWLPTKLERQLAAARVHPDAAMIATGVRFIDAATSETLMIAGRQRYGFLLKELLFDDFMTTSSLLITRSSLASLGRGFREDLSWGEDWDLKVHLAARFPVLVLAEVLVHYFVAPGTLSRSRHPTMLRDIVRDLHAAWRQDPAIQPEVDHCARALGASAHYLTAREYYRQGDLSGARAEIVLALLRSWSFPQVRTALLMLAIPPSVQAWVRRRRSRRPVPCPLSKGPHPCL